MHFQHIPLDINTVYYMTSQSVMIWTFKLRQNSKTQSCRAQASFGDGTFRIVIITINIIIKIMSVFKSTTTTLYQNDETLYLLNLILPVEVFQPPGTLTLMSDLDTMPANSGFCPSLLAPFTEQPVAQNTTVTYPVTLSLSLSLSHTHTHTLTYKHTHNQPDACTHTHTHTHTHIHHIHLLFWKLLFLKCVFKLEKPLPVSVYRTPPLPLPPQLLHSIFRVAWQVLLHQCGKPTSFDEHVDDVEVVAVNSGMHDGVPIGSQHRQIGTALQQ